jgi:hypothetical protein
VKTEENETMDDKVPAKSTSSQIIEVSKSPVPDDQSKIEDDVAVEMVLEGVTSDTDDLVTREVVAVQLNIIASESESPSVSDHVAQELQAVSEAAVVDEIRGSTVIEDIKNEFSDRTTEAVEQHGDRGSFVSAVPEVTMDDGKDLVSSMSTPHASACDSASSVEGTPVFDNPHQTTGGEYKPVNEGFRRNAVAEDMVSSGISVLFHLFTYHLNQLWIFLLTGIIYNAVLCTITKCSLDMFLLIEKKIFLMELPI